jgi:uncharacterized membrane protein
LPKPARHNLDAFDVAALLWLGACWVGYTLYADHKATDSPSLMVAMRLHRREWFRRVLQHEIRIADIAAVSSLHTGATFFASTSMLVLGGLVALLGADSSVVAIVGQLPFARPEPEAVSRLKIVVMIGMFVYAFFKFTWSIRQYHFCAVLIGAAPLSPRPEEHEEYVDSMTRVSSYAAEDFNQGLRTFYFALAAMLWFFHAGLSMLASAIVVFVLYQREFRSPTLCALTETSSLRGALGQRRFERATEDARAS